MTKVKYKRVFLSGPMTGQSCYNVAAFAEAHHRLIELGAADVYDPAVEYLTDPDPTHKTHEMYMQRCINELTRLSDVMTFEEDGRLNRWSRSWDVLVSLPGWKDSEGARVEAEVAKAIGIEVCELGDVE